MRYTTIIDITEFRQAYANVNVRLVYLHLVLISGYEDKNRDFADISLRYLAQDVGITLSALRHALKVLSALSLIQIQDGRIKVTKWLPDKTITKRPRNARERADQSLIIERQQQEIREYKEKIQRQQAQERERLTGKNDFERHIDDLRLASANGDESATAALRRYRQMGAIK